MDLRQKRLTSEEWDALEVPISKNEEKILKMIQNGFLNVNITDNDTMSLINFIKINTDKIDNYHKFFYDKYFSETIKKKKRKSKLKKLMKLGFQIQIKN